MWKPGMLKTPEQQLHQAIEMGNISKVCELLDSGASVNCLQDGVSPLGRALECGQHHIANQLLGYSPNVHEGRRVMHCTHRLHKAGRQQYHEPLLWLAASRGYTDVVKRLIELGADVNSADDFSQRTALHIAALQGDTHVAEILLNNYVYVNKQDIQSQSPLHLAARENNVAMVLTLIEGGAKVNLAGDEERTPLHNSCLHGNVDVSKVLVQHGALVNSLDHFHASPLHYVATKGHVELCQFLLNHDAKVSAVDDMGEMPLHRACRTQSNPEIIGNLIRQGHANPNVEGGPDTLKKLPLQIAAAEGHLDLVKKLLECGADLNRRDVRSNETALHWAIRRRQLHVVDYLLSQGINIDDINLPDGCTALHLACLCDNNGDMAKVAQCLIQKGVDCSHVSYTQVQTALHIAAYSGSYPLMKVFTDAKISLNYVDGRGDTPLMVAVRQWNLTLVNHLIDNGCSVNIANKKGETCLHLLISQGLYDLATKLVQGGCSATQQNKLGQSPLKLTSRMQGAISAMHDDSRLKLIMTLFAAGASSKSLFTGSGRHMNLVMVKVKNRELYNLAVQYAIIKQSSEKDPLPLYECCTQQLRKHLSQANNGGVIFKAVQELPLPRSIKEHVLLRDLAWRSAVL